ncbi:MAG TPA: response regulator transcription factor [bacterium]
MAIRVLLADDQTLIRMGLKMVLRPARDIEVVGESENCRDALEKAVALSPDLVLMDFLTSGGGGIEATRAIKHQCPKTQILILTMFADPQLFRKSAAAGASGYVLKDISPENLTNAIRAVHGGRTMISPVMARHMMDGLFNGNGATPATTNGHLQGITEREIDVLTGVAKGLSDKEIASNLFLSESTVKTHLRTVYHRLNFRNRAQAAAFAVENHILPRA